MALIGWAVVAAIFFGWQGFALASDRVPTLSELIDVVAANLVGRWVLFALWLWIGWHVFIRGWQFFLRE